ncbi:MAG: lipid-A-disaccharide synthase N-terminal domain-containing protein [Hyphomicrobiaceae bacterium]
MDAFVIKLATWWANTSTTEMIWLGIGFSAQLMFSMRFIVQWIASERARQSIVPEMFWYFSFAGGAMLFAYAIYRVDPVFILGQGTGLLIYARNIHFIWQNKRAVNSEQTSQKVAAE